MPLPTAIKTPLLRLGRHQFVARTLRALVPLDKAVTQRTGGRVHIFPEALVPQLMLTTIGRRSGQLRTVPLVYLKDGDGYVVIASNFGQSMHPAWSYNLDANPEADVQIRTRTTPVRATPVSDDDRIRLWPSITAIWPAYDNYVDWAGGRTIKLYRLTPR